MALPTHYTVDEVAASLRCDESTIRSYIKKGKVRPIRIGRNYRFSDRDVEQLRQALTPPPPTTRRRSRREATA